MSSKFRSRGRTQPTPKVCAAPLPPGGIAPPNYCTDPAPPTPPSFATVTAAYSDAGVPQPPVTRNIPYDGVPGHFPIGFGPLAAPEGEWFFTFWLTCPNSVFVHVQLLGSGSVDSADWEATYPYNPSGPYGMIDLPAIPPVGTAPGVASVAFS